MATKTYISISMLAMQTGLPKAYLKRLAKAKMIPFLNAGGRLRFNLEAVQDKLAELAKGGTDEK